MSQFYELVSEAEPPVSLADMKTYLKIPASVTVSDVLITGLLEVVTEDGEKYTGRSFRAQTFDLLIDNFENRICLRRSPVITIDSVNYLVSNSPVLVAPTVYYLKKGQQWSEILLQDGEEWPTNGDNREQGITIQISTTGYTKAANIIINAIKMHVAYLFFNRGDCDDCGSVVSRNGGLVTSAEKSGANGFYNKFRISRV